MVTGRSPLQGVRNIIRFNWHFYVGALAVLSLLLIAQKSFPPAFQTLLLAGVALALYTLAASLLASLYAYDLSGFYRLSWLPELSGKKVLQISAGFDETSHLLRLQNPGLDLTLADFYDPQKHTEVSIRRARKAYPQPSETIAVQTGSLPFEKDSFDGVLLLLSAHEIRDEAERTVFFREVARITRQDGFVVVAEHLRDGANFGAYSVGVLHFFSRKAWLRVFRAAGLSVVEEAKINPFISTFMLAKNGNTP